ncbi:uncharacterized protein LOC143035572 [Oratosquilla oratoria]|uniref:uncharacterized protein LOC143035572 n=1 Tax=Oratosquilla oratoria TaxID=337810 RepID=UPI003F759830
MAVGLDVHTTYTPTYLDASPSVPQQQFRGEESEDEELPDLEAGPRDEMSDQLPPASGRVPRAHPSSAGKSANTSDMGSGKSRQPSGVGEPGKLDGDRRACLHTCNNKAQCAHLCCKVLLKYD